MTTSNTKETMEDRSNSDRIESFKNDLLNLDIVSVIRKHLTTGTPVTIDNEEYWKLRNAISTQFDVHPNHVVVVGSSRLGFSLKKSKRFVSNEPKDVDVAIVSPQLFDRFWDMVFNVVRFNRTWPHQTKKNKSFVSSLFSGWITPHELPNLSSFERARVWAEFFNELSRTRVCGIRGISGRLYRDWSRLEAYQEIMVNECKRELEKKQ